MVELRISKAIRTVVRLIGGYLIGLNGFGEFLCDVVMRVVHLEKVINVCG